jgi:hypothetical protein
MDLGVCLGTDVPSIGSRYGDANAADGPVALHVTADWIQCAPDYKRARTFVY